MPNRALIIGIDAYPMNKLSGCINDAESMSKYLQASGYDEIIILKNDQATRYNILTQFLGLCISDAYKKCFHFSGHGVQIPSQVGASEQDFRDEAIVCSDGRLITDNELKAILSLAIGKITLIFDCCHSGSICDLKYQLITKNGRFAILQSEDDDLLKSDILCITGCRDEETSAEINGSGLLTSSILKILANGKYIKIRDFYTQLCKLDGVHKLQTPQMSFGNKYIDLDSYLII